MAAKRTYIAIDLKSFYASVECVERGLNPLTTNLVVADKSRTEKTICLAVSPPLKAHGISGRARLFEVVQRVKEVNALRRRQAPGHRFTGKSAQAEELRESPELELDYIVAPPRMAYYLEYSTKIYQIYLKYVAPEDIHVYSIDEVFMDVTHYLKTYQKTPRQLAQQMIQDVLENTGITATAGIGTNMYLCKIAMDILAKHIIPDENGVRIASLDEISYRKLLWSHQPITDFWRVGAGYAKKLAAEGLYTMGDIARCSLGKGTDYYNEDLLYKMFGVNAELLIDHAWGYETCRMSDIKNYHSEEHSLSNGQVLMRNYSFDEALVIVREMTDNLVLDLFEKGLVTNSLTLWIAYDHRYEHEASKGTVKLERESNSSKKIIDAVEDLYLRIADRYTGIRRIEVCANRVAPESYVQYSLFDDPKQTDKERHLQEAVLNVKQRYGKNAIMRGSNLLECSTYRERNEQIGGHRA